MSFARILSASLSIAAFAGSGRVQAQYQQPWTGNGIPAAQIGGGGQILVATQKTPERGFDRESPARALKSTRLMIRVENISQGEALKLSTGGTAPFVSAPVLWAVHGGSTNPLFSGGARDAGEGLELLAETGDPSKLAKALAGKSEIVSIGADARPVGATADGPLTPGQKYEFEITARPGQLLSMAWMFGQSNDLFYANDRPIALFDSRGAPLSGELTTQLSLWDAGTEANEEPGLGPNQGPRQKTPDAGVVESQGIAHVRDKYTYPRIGEVLRLTITPDKGEVSAK